MPLKQPEKRPVHCTFTEYAEQEDPAQSAGEQVTIILNWSQRKRSQEAINSYTKVPIIPIPIVIPPVISQVSGFAAQGRAKAAEVIGRDDGGTRIHAAIQAGHGSCKNSGNEQTGNAGWQAVAMYHGKIASVLSSAGFNRLRVGIYKNKK